MKHFAIPLLAGMVLCCAQAPAQKPEFKEHISKEFTLTAAASKSTLAVYNLNGAVRVEGYNGDKVIVEIDKKITAKTEDLVNHGKEEFKLNFEQRSDSIVIYISEPYDTRPWEMRPDGKRDWKNDQHKKIEYHVDLDFIVKVPNAMNLTASTVNGGNVTINDVTGLLNVSNVNGAIKLTNAKSASRLKTVNGSVEANFLNVPSAECDFRTINGDIKISYPESFAADCQFKTFNGSFYTDFPNTESLPVKVIKNQDTKDSKTVYKLDTETHIRFGSGGQSLRFETFNGNIYIKKQS